jgi:hypothetical protein
MDVSERKATKPTDILQEDQEFGSRKWQRSDRVPKPPDIAQEGARRRADPSLTSSAEVKNSGS